MIMHRLLDLLRIIKVLRAAIRKEKVRWSLFLALISISGYIRCAWFAYDRGVVAGQHGEWTRATSLLTHKLAHSPERPDLLYDTGVASYKSGDIEQAQEYFRRAAEHEATHNDLKERAYFNYGNCSADLKQLHKAVCAYEHALKINPENERVKHNLEVVKKMLEQQQEKQQQESQKNEENQDNKSDNSQEDGDKQKKNEQQANKDENNKEDSSGQSSKQDGNEQRNEEQKCEGNGQKCPEQEPWQENDQEGEQQKERVKRQENREDQNSQKGEQESPHYDQSENSNKGRQRNSRNESGQSEPCTKQQADREQSEKLPHDDSSERDASERKSSDKNGRSLSKNEKQRDVERAKGCGAKTSEKNEGQNEGQEVEKLDLWLVSVLDEHEKKDASHHKELIKSIVSKQMAGHEGQNCW